MQVIIIVKYLLACTVLDVRYMTGLKAGVI